jgi:tRNA threonylcarbamoyladenosine biosynthesis protein TsaE
LLEHYIENLLARHYNLLQLSNSHQEYCLSGKDRNEITLSSTSVEQTQQIGAALGKLLISGDVVCLSGDLGAGKTALTSGIGRGWGTRQPVNSPTFVFVHEHRRPNDETRLFHLDCYRIASEEDAITIGLEDILSGYDIAIIEWPQRVIDFLPTERLWIVIETQDETSRQLKFTALGRRYIKLIDDLHGALS